MKPNPYERSYRDTTPQKDWLGERSQKTPLSRSIGIRTVTCDYCGLVHNKRRDQLKKYSSTFCSVSCSNASRVKRQKRLCVICANAFFVKPSHKQKTCGSKCHKEILRRRMCYEVFNMATSKVFAYGNHERGAAIGPHSSLTEDAVRLIRNDQRPQKQIAKDYGISQSHVSRIKLRKQWGYVE